MTKVQLGKWTSSHRWWRQRNCVPPGSGWGGAKPVVSSQWSSPAPHSSSDCQSLSQSASSSGSAQGNPSLAPCGWHTVPTWPNTTHTQVYYMTSCQNDNSNSIFWINFYYLTCDGCLNLPEVVVELQVGGRWCCLAHGANDVGTKKIKQSFIIMYLL